jgi:hypothetical protein
VREINIDLDNPGMWADPDKAWVSSSCLKVCNPSMEPVKPHLVGGMRLESNQSLYWSHREKVNTLLAGTVMFRVPPGYKVPCKTFTRIVDGPAGTVGWRSFQDFPTCSCDRRRIFNMLRSSKCQSINIWNKHPCQIKFDKMRPIGLPFRRRAWKPWQFSNWPFIRRMRRPGETVTRQDYLDKRNHPEDDLSFSGQSNDCSDFGDTQDFTWD